MSTKPKKKSDPKSAFKKLFEQYKRYDTTTGKGNPEQWRSAFKARMGKEEAQTILQGKAPWDVLGVAPDASELEIKRAFRILAMKFHPDRNIEDTTARMQEITAAYTMMLNE